MKGKRKRAVHSKSKKHKDIRKSVSYLIALRIMRLNTQQVIIIAVCVVGFSVSLGIIIGLLQHLFSYL